MRSISISLIISNYIVYKKSNSYEIYYKDEIVGYYDSKFNAQLLCSNVISDISGRVQDVEVNNRDFRYKKTNKTIEVNTIEEIKENILDALSIQSNLIDLSIKGVSYGTIASEAEGKKVLEKIGEIYVRDSNLDEKDIISVDVKTNIDYENIKGKKSKLDSIETIADNIVNSNIVDSIVDVSIKCNEKKVIDIDPEIQIIRQENMYLGESREEEGVVGSKELVLESTYKNGQKVGEEVISENIIEESKPTMIYKGSKNPINDGVTFLTHPTRGGYITSNFGTRWGRNHNGLDIAHNTGDPIYAAFDGVVRECHYENGYGNKILIEHENNIETIYGHLSKFEINVGDDVKKGDLIGRVGSTGRSTGPHLHFEVRLNGTPVDPSLYIEN